MTQTHDERATTRGKFRLRPRTRKIALTAHVATSVGWLGGAYCMSVLAITAASSDNHLAASCYELMHHFDRTVNVPLGLAMLVTGLVSAAGSPWGLIRHRWVLTKLIASTLILILVPILSVPRVLELIERLHSGQDTGALPVTVLMISLGAVTALTAITTVSIFKPWGRTRWATRPNRT